MSRFELHDIIPEPSPDRSRIGAKAAGIAQARYCDAKTPPSRYMLSRDVALFLESLSHHAEAKLSWNRRTIHSSAPESILNFKEDIESSQLPFPWIKAVVNLFHHWHCERIYIRSNYGCEDHSDGALAGCFTSEMCFNNSDSIQDAIRKVLASAFSASSIDLLMASGVSFEQIKPNVLIQPVITGEFGGVAFSRNPNNPWTLPNSNQPWGLFEWSAVDPSVVCEGDTNTAEQSQFGTAVPKSLDPTLYKKLQRTVLSFERALKRPVDVEWIWSGGKLTILQLRPMVDQVAQLAARTKSNQVWSRHLTEERFAEPVSPLGWDALQPSLRSSVQGLRDYMGIKLKNPSMIASSINGYVYASDKSFSFPQFAKLDLLFWFRPIEQLKLVGLLVIAVFSRKKIREIFTWYASLILLDRPFAKLATAYRQRKLKLENDLVRLEYAVENHHERKQTLSSSQITELIDESLKIGQHFMRTDFAVFMQKELHAAVVLKKTGALFSMSENPTLKMHESFRVLSSTLKEWHGWTELANELSKLKSLRECTLRRSTHAVPEYIASEWTSFWRNHGGLRFSWDLRNPNWLSDPKVFINLVNALPDTSTPMTSTNSQYAHLHENTILYRFKKLLWLDEDQHHSACRILSNAHDLTEIAAEMLVEKGVLANTDDVYFLQVEELRSALASKIAFSGFIAQRRKASWTNQTAKLSSAKLLGYHVGETQPSTLEKQASAIRGASFGVASGPAVIAETFADLAHVKPGSILVTSSPKPEFAAIYPLLGGLVTKSGGMLAHGFVAARELGLPAISGFDEMDRVEPGMILTIDGNLGTLMFGVHP